jgi:hypothetical protein
MYPLAKSSHRSWKIRRDKAAAYELHDYNMKPTQGGTATDLLLRDTLSFLSNENSENRLLRWLYVYMYLSW